MLCFDQNSMHWLKTMSFWSTPCKKKIINEKLSHLDTKNHQRKTKSFYACMCYFMHNGIVHVCVVKKRNVW